MIITWTATADGQMALNSHIIGLVTLMFVWHTLKLFNLYFLLILFVGKDCQEKCNKVSEERGQEWISEKESQERREGCKSRERGEDLSFCLLTPL